MNRIYFIVLLFFLISAFTVKKTTNTQNDPGISKLMEVSSLWDILKDGYEPDKDRDGTWLVVGLRSKYAMAKKYAALNMLESAFGKKVFLSGPHGNDMNFQSKTSFGYYNPDFIADFRSVWESAIANPKFKEVLKNVYYKHFQGIADTYFDAYHFLNQNPQFLKALENKYLAEMESNEGVDSYQFNEYFRNFSSLEEQKNLDFYEAITAPSFWLRRSIDGTASQLYDLQVMMMQTFELDFTARVTQTEKDEYELLIQETLLTLNPEIPNNKYPAVTSQTETTSNNTNVFIKYSIGEVVDGGIVFFVDESGEHGLVCANRDQTFSTDWTTCKTRCESYFSISESQMVRGWYLPTIEELGLMRLKKEIIDSTALAIGGEAFDNGFGSWYWSATELEDADTHVKIQAFRFDHTTFSSKETTSNNGRAVKAF